MTKTKFPSLAAANPEKKTYFKAVEEMGNSLKCTNVKYVYLGMKQTPD
jgi:hypothetical protein